MFWLRIANSATAVHALLLITLCMLVSSVDLHAEDWRQFRGNDSSGVSSETGQPTILNDLASLRWKAALPDRGLSGPIVIGERVFVTASGGYRDDQLRLLCFSTTTGAQIWERQFRATGRTICNKEMCMATPQPCSDGERIFAYYSCNDVICLDLDGNLVWYRGLGHDYPNTSNSQGMSSSPVVVDGVLVLQLDTDSESFSTGLNSLTGETMWKKDRDKSAIWASPVVFHSPASPTAQVLMQSTRGLVSIDHKTGSENWRLEQPCEEIPSTTIAGDLLVAPFKALTILQSQAVMQPPEVLWSDVKLSPDTPTPIAYKDRVYVVKGSVLSSAELLSGKPAWRLRLKSGKTSSSPVAANGRLFLVDEDGVLQAVRLGDGKGEVESRVELGEKIMATPAISGGSLYLRSDQHLWKFAVLE